MTKYDKAMELLDKYRDAIDLCQRFNQGWTNKSQSQVDAEWKEAVTNLNEFLKENLTS